VNLISGLRADIAGLAEGVHRVNEKINALIELADPAR
jgi:hypothetical protein